MQVFVGARTTPPGLIKTRVSPGRKQTTMNPTRASSEDTSIVGQVPHRPLIRGKLVYCVRTFGVLLLLTHHLDQGHALRRISVRQQECLQIKLSTLAT